MEPQEATALQNQEIPKRNVKMGLPHFDRCLWFDLKTGNLIMGCINASYSFLLFTVMIVFATEFGTIERDMEIFQTVDTIEADATLSGIYAMAIILVLLFLAKFLFDIFFIYGVVMLLTGFSLILERAGIIKAYFIMWTVFTILSTFTFFLHVHFFGAKTIITELIYIALNVYAMLLSHSFYVQLNTREEI